MSGVLGPSIRSVSTPMLNINAEPILNRFLGYTKYKASRRLIGILKSSCTNSSKIAFPRRTSFPCIPFPNKNLKISCGLRVLSSPYACSLQKPQIVTSFAAVTNLPTVISLSLLLFSSVLPETPIIASPAVEPSLSSCPSHFQVSGSGTAIFLSLVLDGMPSIPLVFRLLPHSFSRCLAPSSC